MTSRTFDIYIPLKHFRSTVDRFELAPGLFIQRLSERPDLHYWWERLGRADQDDVSRAVHWLIFRWRDGTEPEPRDQLYLMLLALWLVKPTKTEAAYLFQLGPDATSDGEVFFRLHDLFACIPGTANEKFSKAELTTASRYHSELQNLYGNRGRLNDALLLTLAGCFAHFWQVALVSYAAAAETLLTYSKARGLTERLALAYACLLEANKKQRDVAVQEFRNLYAVRSDIMHGRTYAVPIADRLTNLKGFTDLMRKLWQHVLSSKTVIAELEGTDRQRAAYFKRLSAGYRAAKP